MFDSIHVSDAPCREVSNDVSLFHCDKQLRSERTIDATDACFSFAAYGETGSLLATAWNYDNGGYGRGNQ